MNATRTCLCIGVNNYAPALGELRFCAADAAAVKRALDARRDGFSSTQSVLMADGRTIGERDARPPTRATIIGSIKDICEQATDDDVVVIQFSGHGVLGGDERLYLLPIDAIPNAIEETGISWHWLIAQIERSSARKKILIIDACHSGAGKGANEIQTRSQRLVNTLEETAHGFVCLSSCSGGQLSHELPDLGHGIFSHYLANGILGAADPLRTGVIDIASLYTFARERTIQHAHQIGVKQEPYLISRVAAPLDTFVLTAVSLDRPIDRVLVVSEDPLLGHLLKIGIAQSPEVRGAVWRSDIDDVVQRLQHGCDYAAAYVDIRSDWHKKREFISLVRKRYPAVPFVLVGAREAFLSSLEEGDRLRFGCYFFFDTATAVAQVPAAIAATLAQIEWDIATRYGERSSMHPQREARGTEGQNLSPTRNT